MAAQQVSAHWIRHTTLTWVERNFGFAVAQAYAGHEDHGRGGRAMATYVRAGLPEVAAALAVLTGEPIRWRPELSLASPVSVRRGHAADRASRTPARWMMYPPSNRRDSLRRS